MNINVLLYANGDQEVLVDGVSVLVCPSAGRQYCDDILAIAQEMSDAFGCKARLHYLDDGATLGSGNRDFVATNHGKEVSALKLALH